MARDPRRDDAIAVEARPFGSRAPSPILARLRTGLGNALLVLASIAVAYVACEFILFRILLPTWPPGVRTYLPETADVLVQNSKAGAIPHDYTAILGDSYSEGIGDWLLDVGEDRSKPFHSANIIQDLTGHDVVSFGREGIGSAEALVRMPTHILEGSKCFLFPRLPEPSRMVVYFYEGNDIQDNLSFLRKVAAEYGSSDARTVAEYLSNDYGTFAAWRCHLHLGDTIGRMGRLYYYALTRRPDLAAVPEDGPNRLIVGGREIHPPHLEGPAVDMQDDEIETGARVFDQSLDWLRHRFAGVPVTVVYIPSALSVYRLAGDHVTYMSRPVPGNPPWRRGEAPVAKVARNSDLLSGLIREASLRQAVDFVDARPALRQAAAGRLVHGPKDWNHLNEAGYRVLGQLVAEHLQSVTSDR